jgi:hypothetical protein
MEKDQRKIEDIYVRCRHLGISTIYCSQVYYKIPKTVRLNANYIVLKKLGQMRDLNMILSDFPIDIERKDFMRLYNYCTKGQPDFMLIDCNANKIRKNFLEILN